jgi:hypothetical protein
MKVYKYEWWSTPIGTPHRIGYGSNNGKQCNKRQKTKVKKRTTQIIVLKIQSDEMLRSCTGLLTKEPEQVLTGGQKKKEFIPSLWPPHNNSVIKVYK